MSNNQPNLTCNEAILSDEYFDVLIEYSLGNQIIENTYKPACIQVINEQLASMYIRQSSITLDPMETYGYNNIPKCYGLLDTSAVDSVGVFQLRRLPYINLNGRNVILGFLDTGIDYTHEVFINADNSSRIVGIWDQTIQDGNRPADLDYGSEYTNEDITNALRSDNPLSIVPSVDTNGHGTFLAGVAAGNINDEDDFSGVAPLARIAMVKLKPAKQNLRNYYGIPTNVECFQENDIMLGIRYLMSVATKYNLPIVICLGIGSNSGGHEGTSFLDYYIQLLSNSIGISVCCGGGNEGNLRHHFFNTISENSVQNVEVQVASADTAFTIELWNSPPGSLSVGFISPGGEEIDKIPVRFNAHQSIKFFPEPTIIDINYDPTDIRSGDSLVQMRFRNLTPGIWTIKVYNDTTFELPFHMWLPMEHFISPDTFFLRPDPDTTLSATANGYAEVSVAAYNHQNDSIYLNSSRGYTRRDRIKPDIAAPGVNVFGPGLNNSYTTRSGTSVSAAMTAGIVALLFEWAYIDYNMLNLTGNAARLYLIRGAEQQNIPYPNKEWGYGTVDIFEVFSNLRSPL